MKKSRSSWRSTGSLYKNEVQERLSRTVFDEDLITEDALAYIPEPVQRYLKYTGWVGKPRVINFRLEFRGQFSLGPGKKYFNIKAQQYNFMSSPTRLFHMKSAMFGVKHRYANGQANMLVKLFDRFKIIDASSPELHSSELLTYFNDLCIMAPGGLISNTIEWETVDPKTVRASISDHGMRVFAMLHFNDEGELVNFVTDERYHSRDGKEATQVRWSTPVSNYKEVNGLKYPTYGEAIWHFEEGDFPYAKFHVVSLKHNVKNFE